MVLRRIMGFGSVKLSQSLMPIAIIPLIIFGYGVEEYGVLATAQAINSYALLFVNFGFDLTAVYILKDKKNSIKQVLLAVTFLKLLILLFVYLGILVISQYLDFFSNNLLLVFSCGYILASDIFLPVWWFQIKEKALHYAALIFLVKVSQILVILLSLYFNLTLLQLTICMLNITVALSIISYIYCVRYQNKREDTSNSLRFWSFVRLCVSLVRESTPIFLSKASQMYLSFNRVIVGVVLGPLFMAAYDIAERILNLFRAPLTVYIQVFYPDYVACPNFKRSMTHALFFVVLTSAGLFLLYLIMVSTDLVSSYLDIPALYPFFILLSAIPISINSINSSCYFIASGQSKVWLGYQIRSLFIYAAMILFFLIHKDPLIVFLVLITIETFCSIMILKFFFRTYIVNSRIQNGVVK